MIPIAKPFFTLDEEKAASAAIRSGWVTQGPRVREFEEKFAAYTGAKYAVAVSSCTAALHLALLTAGIGKGDEVICPSLSFIATANAITYTGAKPVFADIDHQTCNIDPASAAKVMTKKTKAVLVVHQIGCPADITGFRRLCREHGLKLIEDAACAIGSAYKGKKIGSHSELVCFSFHPRKVITTGDGGMITTSSRTHYEHLKLLRQHGMSVSDTARHMSKKVVKEQYGIIGFNYRMTDIQAAVGIRQLKKLDRLVNERNLIARRYRKAFQNLDCVQLPEYGPGVTSNYQSFMMYLRSSSPVSRDALMQNLLDEGISTRRGIMTIHREKPYASLKQSLPVSEDVSDNSICLPVYVPMKAGEQKRVISCVRNVLSSPGAPGNAL